jgi:hypothetical protein
MYAESKVMERMALAEKEFHFRLEQHSVADVEAFEQRLIHNNRYVIGDMGQTIGTHNLDDFERAWMLNEQILVLCDAAYFLTRYAYLRTEEGVIQRFKFRVPQRIYFDIICDLESRNAAIEICSPGSRTCCRRNRRLGSETFVRRSAPQGRPCAHARGSDWA